MSSHFFSPKIRGQERKTRVRASESVARERRGTEPLVAPKSEDASNSSHVKHSNSRTHAQLVCARRNFLRKQEAARSLQQFEWYYQWTPYNCQGSTMAIKMYMWINLSIIGIFQQNTKTIKRVFFCIQITIKNIQCRAGHIKLCLFLMFKFLKTISLLLCVLRDFSVLFPEIKSGSNRIESATCRWWQIFPNGSLLGKTKTK